MLGLVLKAYDEIEDLNITVSPVITEFLKLLQIVFLTLISHDDLLMSLSTFTLISISYISGGVDNSFWYALWLISFSLVLISLQYYKNIFLLEFCSLLLVGLGILIEPFIFTEEYSIRKLIFRTIFIILLGLVEFTPFHDLIKNYIGSTRYTDKIFMFVIGYFILSVCSQIYLLFIKDKPTSDEPYEEYKLHHLSL